METATFRSRKTECLIWCKHGPIQVDCIRFAWPLDSPILSYHECRENAVQAISVTRNWSLCIVCFASAVLASDEVDIVLLSLLIFSVLVERRGLGDRGL